MSLRIAAVALIFSAACACAEDGQWVGVWLDGYKDGVNAGFDPEKLSAVVGVDRTSGDVFLCGWFIGVWKSSDGGKSFARVDKGKITGPGCGPIQPNSIQISPEGKKIAIFNMWNSQGPSGYSLDGGGTWESFANVGRDWDFGAMDFESKTALGARHEFDGLHLTVDGGKTWTQLKKSRADPWLTGLGALGPDTLLAATEYLIERSEDGGKTWTKISDLGGTGPVVRFKDKLWWLGGAHKKTVLESADQGKTWAVAGAPLPANCVAGPLFGKDENHVVVATNEGFYESTDGCKTWKLAVPLPEDCPLRGAAFDPVHDTFYATSTNRPLMKFVRGQAPEYAWPAAPIHAADPARPKAEFVETPAARGLRCMVTQSLDLCNGALYVSGEDGVIPFKQDAASGKLACQGQIKEERSGGFVLTAAGGRLYGVTPHDGYRRMTWHGLAWFEIGANGEPVKKGVAVCPASRQIVAGPDQKDLYLKSCAGKEDKVYGYRIDADGKPEKTGEVVGKGIGASSHNRHPGLLRITPDGKHLYTISAQDYALACIERKADGGIAYKDATDLEALLKRPPGNDRLQWVSLGISPDGKWVYASVRNGKPTENVYGVYKRDAETGTLTLQEKVFGDKDRLADQKGWNMVFAPSGTGGYLGSQDGPLMTFKYDASTGKLTEPCVVKETKGRGSPILVFDEKNGFLYTGGGDFGIVADGLTVLKVDKK
ncbi:MAG: beta-propeller fold lactonase family protein [Planctomycetes bacterium]|nr:beta-propeller fold lactonase family protein [Planctomycetota bacterium]